MSVPRVSNAFDSHFVTFFLPIATKQTWKQRPGNRQEVRSESKVPRNKCSPHGGNRSWILSEFPKSWLKICKAQREFSHSLHISRRKTNPPTKYKFHCAESCQFSHWETMLEYYEFVFLLISGRRCFPFSVLWGQKGLNIIVAPSERGEQGFNRFFMLPKKQSGSSAQKETAAYAQGQKSFSGWGSSLSVLVWCCCECVWWRVCICLRCVNLNCSSTHTAQQWIQNLKGSFKKRHKKCFFFRLQSPFSLWLKVVIQQFL